MDIVRFRTRGSALTQIGVRADGQLYSLPRVASLASLWTLPIAEIRRRVEEREAAWLLPADDATLLPPIDGRTEVWGAGVTYESSRQARVAESERSADVYLRVYDAKRPELFFKSAAWRVVGDGQTARRRRSGTTRWSACPSLR
jgi:2-dehydro-3-deoxy-D-arabinonate dehydratase